MSTAHSPLVMKYIAELTSPWWMTKSRSVTGSKGCRQPPNSTHALTQEEIDETCTNLGEGQYEAFATFLATVVAHFHTQWGIAFDLYALGAAVTGQMTYVAAVTHKACPMVAHAYLSLAFHLYSVTH